MKYIRFYSFFLGILPFIASSLQLDAAPMRVATHSVDRLALNLQKKRLKTARPIKHAAVVHNAKKPVRTKNINPLYTNKDVTPVTQSIKTELHKEALEQTSIQKDDLESFGQENKDDQRDINKQDNHVEEPVDQELDQEDPLKKDPITELQQITRSFAEKPVLSSLQKVSHALKQTHFYAKNPLTALKDSPWNTTQNIGNSLQNQVDKLPVCVKKTGSIIWKNSIKFGAASVLVSLGLPRFLALGIWESVNRSFWMRQIFDFFCKKADLKGTRKTVLSETFKYFFETKKDILFGTHLNERLNWNSKSKTYNSLIDVAKETYKDEKALELYTQNTVVGEILRDSLKEIAIITATDLEKDCSLARKIIAIFSAALSFHNGENLSTIMSLKDVIFG